VLAAAPEPFLDAADEELIDLDLAAQRLALGRDHGAAQLVQDQPRGLIARQSQLTLPLLGRDPRMVGGHQIRSGAAERPGLLHRGRSSPWS
jgi:hypothetical protein